MKRFFYIILLVLLFGSEAVSQIPEGMPPITNYSDEDYYAATQNWFALQDSSGMMYFGNRSAILIFDGLNWQQVPVGGRSVFSLAQDKSGKIWAGLDGDIGYLETDDIGNTFFVSILEQIPAENKNFSKIWSIFVIENEIFFQSKESVITYDTKNEKTKVINAHKHFSHSYKLDGENKIFVQEDSLGLLIYQNHELVPVKQAEVIGDELIKGVLPAPGNNHYFVTRNGFYLCDTNRNFSKIESPLDFLLKNKNIYKAFLINNNYFAFSIPNYGVLITDHNFNLIKNVSIKNGVLSNNIYHVFCDKDNNIWLSSDEGISFFSLFPRYTLWGLNFGLASKTISSTVFENKIYIGNKAGIRFYEFYNSDNKSKEHRAFDTIANNLALSTYYLGVHNNELLGLNHNGFFEIKNNRLEYIKKQKSLRLIIQYDQETIIVRGEKELLMFKYEQKRWSFVQKIKNFNKKITAIQKDSLNNIWVLNDRNNIEKLVLDKNKISVTSEIFKQQNLPKITNIYKLENQVVFATTKGLYKYNYKQKKFYPITKINDLIGKNQVYMVFTDSNKNIWLKVQDQIIFNRQKINVWNLIKLIPQKDGSYLAEKEIFKKFQNKIFHFNQINDSLFIIGNKKGFTIFNDNTNTNFKFSTLIRSFEYIVNKDSSVVLFSGASKKNSYNFKYEQSKIHVLPYENNSVRFTYSALDYANNSTLQFRCFLEGFDKDWTQLSHKNSREYANLPEGDYIFKVKTKNIYGIETEVATYKFTILPPWYRTTYAYLAYIILGFAAIFILFRIYSHRLRKRKEYLEELVRQRTAEISQQNEEIKTQNEILFDKNEEIEQQKEEIEKQRDIAFKQKQEITDSIIYAQRIQVAILPRKEYLKEILPEYFILFKPRDIVSGDYFWIDKIENKLLIVTADSTGHGVPGAFMSMLGVSLLNEIVGHNKINQPGEVLDLLRARLKESLHQQGGEDDAKDGYDLSFYMLDNETLELEFSGAFNSIYIIRAADNSIEQMKADRQPVAIYINEKKFNNHKTQLQKGDTIYSFSDGYADQFGGENPDYPQKFKTKRFKKLLQNIQDQDMQQQKQTLNQEFENWRGNEPQLDDVIVIGLRV